MHPTACCTRPRPGRPHSCCPSSRPWFAQVVQVLAPHKAVEVRDVSVQKPLASVSSRAARPCRGRPVARDQPPLELEPVVRVVGGRPSSAVSTSAAGSRTCRAARRSRDCSGSPRVTTTMPGGGTSTTGAHADPRAAARAARWLTHRRLVRRPVAAALAEVEVPRVGFVAGPAQPHDLAQCRDREVDGCDAQQARKPTDENAEQPHDDQP